MSEFTAREKDVIKFIVEEGMTNRDIAERLDIREGTVKQTIYNVFNKLHISSREVLIIKYYKEALKSGNIKVSFDEIIAKVI